MYPDAHFILYENHSSTSLYLLLFPSNSVRYREDYAYRRDAAEATTSTGSPAKKKRLEDTQ